MRMLIAALNCLVIGFIVISQFFVSNLTLMSQVLCFSFFIIFVLLAIAFLVEYFKDIENTKNSEELHKPTIKLE